MIRQNVKSVSNLQYFDTFILFNGENESNKTENTNITFDNNNHFHCD